MTHGTHKTNETIRVMSVVPGAGEGSSMVFCRRVIEATACHGIETRTFHLASRTSPIVLFRERRRFRNLVREFAPHVVHAQYGTTTSLFCALMSPVPLVVTFRGSDLNPTPSLPRFLVWTKTFMSRLSAARARVSICVSEELRGRLWWGRDRAIVLPSGVDTAVFHPRSREQSRRSLGWGDEPVVLFYSGRHPRVKRLDLARAAVALLADRLSGARLCEMDGSIDPADVPVYMSAADCFLMTSDYEGSPTVVQEAKACDLPVVSVKVGDIEEQLAGVANCAVSERDPTDLADALFGVLQRGERSDGSHHVETASLVHIGAATAEIYKSLVAGEERT